MKSLLLSVNCVTGIVLFSSLISMRCLLYRCSLMAPLLRCGSSRLLRVLRVWPMYMGLESSQSSRGQEYLYTIQDFDNFSEGHVMLFFKIRFLVLKFFKLPEFTRYLNVAPPSGARGPSQRAAGEGGET